MKIPPRPPYSSLSFIFTEKKKGEGAFAKKKFISLRYLHFYQGHTLNEDNSSEKYFQNPSFIRRNKKRRLFPFAV